jgi:hypothetical protein
MPAKIFDLPPLSKSSVTARHNTERFDSSIPYTSTPSSTTVLVSAEIKIGYVPATYARRSEPWLLGRLAAPTVALSAHKQQAYTLQTPGEPETPS